MMIQCSMDYLYVLSQHKKREGIRHLFDYIYRVLENADKKISTNKLNNILRKALDTKSIPFKGKSSNQKLDLYIKAEKIHIS